MKINKLYTLSQFVDLLQDSNYDIEPGDAEAFSDIVAERLGLIYRYNNFLKKPIAREMFESENEKEILFDLGGLTLDDMYPDCICIKNAGVLPFGFPVFTLAEATKGELELKNVEL